MPNALNFIKNNQELLSLLGKTPSFHGAEIMVLLIRPDEQGRMCLESQLRFSRSGNGNGKEVQRRSAIVTLKFFSVDMHIVSRYQKILSDIRIMKSESDPVEPEKFEVEIHTLGGGCQITFSCTEISVIKIEYPV